MRSLSVALRHILALSVHDAKIELRDAITLLSSFAIPLDRLGAVPRTPWPLSWKTPR
jgi:hypothetical protein